jgi:hypothetical protein
MRKTVFRKWLIVFVTLANACLLLGLRREHPISSPVFLIDAPDSLNQLVNHEGRRYGYWVNSEDRFYYVGDAAAFAAFLKQYADVAPIAGHKLTLHEGSCTDYCPCDWKLEVGRVSWRKARGILFHNDPGHSHPPGEDPEYLAEIHLWLESNVNLIPLEIPQVIQVAYATLIDPLGPR